MRGDAGLLVSMVVGGSYLDRKWMGGVGSAGLTYLGDGGRLWRTKVV